MVDVDECEDEQVCEYGCHNAAGSYQCLCPDGFRPTGQFSRCVDENECERRPGVCGGGSCNNQPGSFDCRCPNGMIFDTVNVVCIHIGGGSCHSSPCLYGCTPTAISYTCSCPRGYQTIGQGHCIQTLSPPGSSLPPGIQLPHVAAPSGSDGVPSGEGCYMCDVDAEGIALSKPRRPSYLRVRRSLEDDTHIHIAEESLVLDVSGPHSTNYARDVTTALTESNVTVIRIAEVAKNLGRRDARELLDEDGDDEVSARNASKTMDVRADRPVLLYVWREETGAGRLVMSVRPSLVASQESCHITAGNKHLLFSLTHEQQVHALRFNKKVHKRKTLELKVTCTLLGDHVASDVTKQSLDILLHIHIV